MYIEREAAKAAIKRRLGTMDLFESRFNADIDAIPAADVVEVKTLESWLYEIAMNNTKNPLSDACEEIISRLDGLRVFAREQEDANA